MTDPEHVRGALSRDPRTPGQADVREDLVSLRPAPGGGTPVPAAELDRKGIERRRKDAP